MSRSKAEAGPAAAERVRPFKPASPMKRATAPQAGELSGTISGRYAYILVSAPQSVPPAAEAAALVHVSALYGFDASFSASIQAAYCGPISPSLAILF